ncbi:MAG: hypothetical protein MZV65_42760 [Chromatiales bacterium]|nr:hypothetical protein [Chromatiales bacterium]
MVALDMWYSGELPEIEEPEDWDGTEDDSKLKALLTPVAKNFESRLMVAVEKGTLNPARERRDFDERLVADHTVISYAHLASWLEERGYTRGDIFDDWANNQATLHDLLAQEAAYLRAEHKRGVGLVRRLGLEKGFFNFCAKANHSRQKTQ